MLEIPQAASQLYPPFDAVGRNNYRYASDITFLVWRRQFEFQMN